MIDLREPYEPLRLERIEVREKIAAAYVKGKQMGEQLAAERCLRLRITWAIAGFLAGVIVTYLAIGASS